MHSGVVAMAHAPVRPLGRPGYAEYVVAEEAQVMPVPPGLSLVDAAAIPEVLLFLL